MVSDYSYSQSTISTAKVGTTLRVPALIGGNMVLQRDKPVTVRGWAGSGERVTIHIGNEKYFAFTDKLGIWKTNLKPKPAGGPFVIRITTAHDSLMLKISCMVMYGYAAVSRICSLR